MRQAQNALVRNFTAGLGFHHNRLMFLAGSKPRRLLLWSFVFVVLLHPIAHGSATILDHPDQRTPSSSNNHECLLCRVTFDAPVSVAVVLVVHEADPKIVRPADRNAATPPACSPFGQRAPPLA
jgi:hypothetical protein